MRIWLLVISFFPVVFFAAPAYAYIGPGAGFAVAGSFLVIFAAVISAVIILITWPVRALIRAIRFRNVYARARIRRAIVLGFDGMDHALTTKMIDEGKLPNFAALRDRGLLQATALNHSADFTGSLVIVSNRR